MTPASFKDQFDKALPVADRTILTIAEVPERMDELLKLFELAMLRGFDNQARLTEIHLPMGRFPFIDSKFWHVPVEDCGNAQVLRFFFEAADAPAYHLKSA
ncbi:MAG: hypothetical protein HYS06_06110 [Methylocystis sp.]|nr:hypothetical protein [Methylocystis sp.]MBI3275106.1 hypothetical protein [Methylocystis sp.]